MDGWTWMLVAAFVLVPFVEYAILRRDRLSGLWPSPRATHPIWLRRSDDRLQVMVEIPDLGWVLAIDDPWPGDDGHPSHIWEGYEGRIWRVDPVAQTGPAVTVSRPPPEPQCENERESERDLIAHFLVHNRQHLPILCAAIDGLLVPRPTPAKRYFALYEDDGDDFYVVARDPENARQTVIRQGIQFGSPSVDLPQAEADGLVTWAELAVEQAERIQCTIPLVDCELGEFLGKNQ